MSPVLRPVFSQSFTTSSRVLTEERGFEQTFLSIFVVLCRCCLPKWLIVHLYTPTKHPLKCHVLRYFSFEKADLLKAERPLYSLLSDLKFRRTHTPITDSRPKHLREALETS